MGQRQKITAMLLATTAILLSCGGGSAGGTTDPVQPDPDTALTWVRSSIHADYAASIGITGQGSTVAILDTGIDMTHFAFVQANFVGSYNANGVRLKDENGHGTAMASTIVGVSADGTVFGVAPKTSILNIDASYSTDGTFSDQAIADGIDYAVTHGADVISMSLGADYSKVYPTYNMDQISHMADVQAVSTATQSGVIVVMATGNESSETHGGFPAYFAGSTLYNNLGLAVTALDADNQIASWATQCNIFNPAYCVAAPGEGIPIANLSGGIILGDGTSPATAIVSGSIALLIEYFPNLTPEQVVQILLTTTDDLGAAGVDIVYGSGKINLQRALQPIGTTTLLNHQASKNLTTSPVMTSSAMAGSFKNIAAFENIPVYDDYSRKYALNLSNVEYLKTNNRERVETKGRYLYDASLSTNIANQRVGIEFGHGDISDFGARHDALNNINTSLMANPFLDLADFNSVGALSHQGETSQSTLGVYGSTENSEKLILASHIHSIDHFELGFGISQFSENGKALGLEISDGFGEISRSKTDSLHMSLAWQGADFGASFRGSYSTTDVSMKNAGLVTGFDELKSYAWAAGVNKSNLWRENDRLDIAVGQGLRVKNGYAQLDGSLLSAGAADKIALAPEGKETTYEIAYKTPITSKLAMIFDASYIKDPQNIKDADPIQGFGVQFEVSF